MTRQLGSFSELEVKAGIFGRSLKETVGTVADSVARTYGVEVVPNGFRCPPNRANGGTFTDAMGTTCGIFLAVDAFAEAVEGAAEAARGVSATDGKPGGRAAAARARSQRIVDAITAAGGSMFRVSDDYVKTTPSTGSVVFRPKTVAEVRATRRETVATFMGHVRRYLTTGEVPATTAYGSVATGFSKDTADALHPDVKRMIVEMSDDELWEVLEAEAVRFHQGLSRNIRVQMKPKYVLSMLKDGRYKTTHETKSEQSAPTERAKYEASIGFPPSLAPELRPASGYITHSDWEDEAARAFAEQRGTEPTEHHDVGTWARGRVGLYGGLELVLRPEVAERTGYGYGDSITTELNPASLDETDPAAIANAVMSHGGRSEDHVRLTLALLEARRTGSFKHLNARYGALPEKPEGESENRDYFEALISGSFAVEDIAEVKGSMADLAQAALGEDGAPPGEMRAEFFNPAMLERMGLSPEEIQFVTGLLDGYKDEFGKPAIPRQLVTDALRQLQEFRRASKVKEQFEAQGVRVVTTSAKGIDLFDVNNYAGAQPGDSVDDVLLRRFLAGIAEEVRKMRERAERVRQTAVEAPTIVRDRA